VISLFKASVLPERAVSLDCAQLVGSLCDGGRRILLSMVVCSSGDPNAKKQSGDMICWRGFDVPPLGFRERSGTKRAARGATPRSLKVAPTETGPKASRAPKWKLD
jgi:hypothetical protein